MLGIEQAAVAHDSNDGKHDAADLDGLIQDGGVAAEFALPVVLAEDGDGIRGVIDVIRGCQQSSQNRAHAHKIEIIAGSEQYIDTIGILDTDEVCRCGNGGGQVFESMIIVV